MIALIKLYFLSEKRFSMISLFYILINYLVDFVKPKKESVNCKNDQMAFDRMKEHLIDFSMEEQLFRLAKNSTRKKHVHVSLAEKEVSI